MDDTPEVDAHEPLEVVVRHALDRGAERDTRVVDHEVHRAVIGNQLRWARRDDEAFTFLSSAVAAQPDYYLYHVFLGLVLEERGDHAGAVISLERGVAMDANNDDLCQLAHAYGTAGRRMDFERTMARIMERREKGFMPAVDIAIAYAGMGERDEAFHWLELALEDHSEILKDLGVEPEVDPLRSDPRFAQILRRVHLTPVIRDGKRGAMGNRPA